MNKTKEQFANSTDLKTKLLNAIVGARAALRPYEIKLPSDPNQSPTVTRY